MHFADFTLHDAVLLFLAALMGGALNAVAGGGSFIAFPALLFTGVPAVPANATNTVALWAGLLFSGSAFRRHLKVQRTVLITLTVAGLLGGIAGALLLLRTPSGTFLRILPWLMLVATLLFIFGPRLTKRNENEEFLASNLTAETQAGLRGNHFGSAEVVTTDNTQGSPRWSTLVVAAFIQLLVALYGGYFGGGMGFVILAMLSVFGMADIHEMNAFKIVLSSAINGIAAFIFIVKHAVFWPQALVMILGAAIGGYCGAHYSLRLPKRWVRWFVIAVGAGMTAYFFMRAYKPAP